MAHKPRPSTPTRQDASRLTLEVGAAEANQRLDRFLARRLPQISRSRLQALLRAGEVSRNETVVSNLSGKVKVGEIYELHVPASEAPDIAGQDIPLIILYEDPELIVIDKPKGLAVHPGPGHASGTLVNALIAHCGASLSGIGGVQRPGIVHRLDRDTTGLLVVAKTDRAHRALAEQFANHGADGRLQRSYRALVWGVPAPPRGRIDAALSRSTSNRTKIAVARTPKARRAVTHYEVLRAFTLPNEKPGVSLLRLTLETGRTHQIRVHTAHIGHPLLGDPVYGSGFKSSARRLGLAAQSALQRLQRQALHAAELAFEHPVSGKRLQFTSALPDDMAELVSALTTHA
ncbi:MAG TPA: RluA family pseudouridine synthase [Hyphomicrobiaceae bacterium]|jgi:23S rRNA pseudouridine1911/1915/1917 synthase|nr:RluA family pseudouridine synthase [Hyphomicrobiaceae bacterium]